MSDNLTPRTRALLEKLLIPQLFQIFPALYGTIRFIIVCTRVQESSSCPFSEADGLLYAFPSYLWLIFILSCDLGLTFPVIMPTEYAVQTWSHNSITFAKAIISH